MNHELQMDRAREADDLWQLNSGMDRNQMEFKCEECEKRFVVRDMAIVHDHKDSGCCKLCAEDKDTAEDWGIYE